MVTCQEVVARKKQGVLGAVEHESGKVFAKTQNTFTFVEMKAFLENHVYFEKASLNNYF